MLVRHLVILSQICYMFGPATTFVHISDIRNECPGKPLIHRKQRGQLILVVI